MWVFKRFFSSCRDFKESVLHRGSVGELEREKGIKEHCEPRCVPHPGSPPRGCCLLAGQRPDSKSYGLNFKLGGSKPLHATPPI